MKVRITWKAFGDKPDIGRFVTSASFELSVNPSPKTLLNHIYKATNLQGDLAEFGADEFTIRLWEKIEGILPENRTHTSLSIGDEVDIDGQTYICADIGWVTPEEAEVKYLTAEYGNGAIFSVTKKWVS